MEITVDRIQPANSEVRSMLGIISANNVCYGATLEDVYRGGHKIPGSTAIDPGRYEVKPKLVSAQGEYNNAKYDWHKYALEICDVPNFTDILFHPVRSFRNTEGCVGLGDRPYLNWKTGEWELEPRIDTYKRISLLCYECFENREPVFITINHLKYRLHP